MNEVMEAVTTTELTVTGRKLFESLIMYLDQWDAWTVNVLKCMNSEKNRTPEAKDRFEHSPKCVLRIAISHFCEQ